MPKCWLNGCEAQQQRRILPALKARYKDGMLGVESPRQLLCDGVAVALKVLLAGSSEERTCPAASPCIAASTIRCQSPGR